MANGPDQLAEIDGWFSPTSLKLSEEQLLDFSGLLHGFKYYSLLQAIERKRGTPIFEPWEAAVDVLIRDLPGLIEREMTLEVALYGSPHPGEVRDWRAAALARLLIAAQEVHVPSAIPSYQRGGTVWHSHAQKIRAYLAKVAKQAGTNELVFSHPEAAGVEIVKKALTACGYAVSEEAIVQLFKRRKLKPG